MLTLVIKGDEFLYWIQPIGLRLGALLVRSVLGH